MFIPDPNLGSGVPSFTISLWFKASVTTSTQNRGLLCIPAQGSIKSSFCTYIERTSIGGKITFNAATSSAATSKSNTALNTTDWVHLVGVYDGSKLQMYINNVLQSS